MARGDNQKLKMLHLLKIMAEETDDQHMLTMTEIVDKLKKAGVHADRKTLYSDMAELERFGIDIISQRQGRNTYYHLGARQFDLAVLKILVDSIEAAKFITDAKTKSLIRKLSGLVSRFDADALNRQVELNGRVKTTNRLVFNNVDALHSAISAEKQIRFHYCKWDIKGNMVPRNDGAWYYASPWQLMINNDYYYLVAYSPETDSIRHYRVDKIKDIYVVDEPRQGKEAFNNFDFGAYAKCMFGMFGGEEKRVTLECDMDMIGVIIDRFGKDVTCIPKGERAFVVSVNVIPSLQFLGWVVGLGDRVKIISPDDVIQQMRNEVKRLSTQYFKASEMRKV